MAEPFSWCNGLLCVQFRFLLLGVDYGSYSYEGNEQRIV